MVNLMCIRKPVLILSVLLLLTTIIACGDRRNKLQVGRVNGESGSADMVTVEEQALPKIAFAAQAAPPSAKSAAGDIQRKLLKEGSIYFEADDIRETYAFIKTLCQEHNAYISSESQNNYGSRLQQELIVRIPADRFDAYLGKLQDHAVKVEAKSVDVKDVTEEFIDTEARLKTKKQLEQRYLDLLRQAKTVTDVIAVEAQLVNVRADIESMEGRLKYLNNRVTLSTLNITFYEVIGTDFGFGSKSVAALGQGWDNLLAFLIGVLYLWPFILLIAAMAYGFIRWRKRRKIRAGVPDPGSNH